MTSYFGNLGPGATGWPAGAQDPHLYAPSKYSAAPPAGGYVDAAGAHHQYAAASAAFGAAGRYPYSGRFDAAPKGLAYDAHPASPHAHHHLPHHAHHQSPLGLPSHHHHHAVLQHQQQPGSACYEPPSVGPYYSAAVPARPPPPPPESHVAPTSAAAVASKEYGKQASVSPFAALAKQQQQQQQQQQQPQFLGQSSAASSPVAATPGSNGAGSQPEGNGPGTPESYAGSAGSAEPVSANERQGSPANAQSPSKTENFYPWMKSYSGKPWLNDDALLLVRFHCGGFPEANICEQCLLCPELNAYFFLNN
ncbi:hypothetical protein V5799_000702 [Amblyomma americanum]|uniref:Uncharacterized protein n=1 Tax=Amblyomma americanum TaxID=6943 RepID=A0AAQ4D2A6_AMBAM